LFRIPVAVCLMRSGTQVAARGSSPGAAPGIGWRRFNVPSFGGLRYLQVRSCRLGGLASLSALLASLRCRWPPMAKAMPVRCGSRVRGQGPRLKRTRLFWFCDIHGFFLFIPVALPLTYGRPLHAQTTVISVFTLVAKECKVHTRSLRPTPCDEYCRAKAKAGT